MRNLAIIQARMGSSRLPGKVMLELAGKTVIECVVDRVLKSELVDDVVVATSIDKGNLPLIEKCAAKGIRIFCGSEDDVLDRFYQAAKLFQPENVIRITADCPLLDPQVVDQVVRRHMETGADYTSNTIEPTYPDGLDCEIMKYSVLHETWKKAKLASDREHVTQYIIHHDFEKQCVRNDIDYSAERWTIDTPEDYALIKKIYDAEECENGDFNSVVKYLDQHPELRTLNSQFERNEGLIKSLNNDHNMVLDEEEV